MRSVNVTLWSIVVSFSYRTSEGDTVIVNRGAGGCCGEIPMDPSNSKCNKSKPFDRADGEPLNVTEGDGEHENLLAIDVQINVHHVGGKLAGGILGGTLLRECGATSSGHSLVPCTALYALFSTHEHCRGPFAKSINEMNNRPDKPLVVKCTFDRSSKKISFSSARNCSYDLLKTKVSYINGCNSIIY